MDNFTLSKSKKNSLNLEFKSFKQNSQNFKILNYLKTGRTLTCFKAMQMGYGMNLRSRISDLKRAGYDVISKQVNTDNGSYIAEYSLEV